VYVETVMRIVEKYDISSVDKDALLRALENEFREGKETGSRLKYSGYIDSILYVNDKAYWKGYDDATLDILGY
jgi:hypothetical protein